MIYEEDWLMKQIKNAVQMIARLFFKKNTIAYEVTNDILNEETDLLYREIMTLLNSMEINEAENLLFNNIKTNDLNYLKISVDFYNRLNELSDEQLIASNFSRDEIKSGLEEIAKMFGFKI